MVPRWRRRRHCAGLQRAKPSLERRLIITPTDTERLLKASRARFFTFWLILTVWYLCRSLDSPCRGWATEGWSCPVVWGRPVLCRTGRETRMWTPRTRERERERTQLTSVHCRPQRLTVGSTIRNVRDVFWSVLHCGDSSTGDRWRWHGASTWDLLHEFGFFGASSSAHFWSWWVTYCKFLFVYIAPPSASAPVLFSCQRDDIPRSHAPYVYCSDCPDFILSRLVGKRSIRRLSLGDVPIYCMTLMADGVLSCLAG